MTALDDKFMRQGEVIRGGPSLQPLVLTASALVHTPERMAARTASCR